MFRTTTRIPSEQFVCLIAIRALEHAAEVIQELGEQGKEALEKNQFGEQALRGDWDAEEAIIETLATANIPIILYSEEHGIIKIGKNHRYIGWLDGLDGSSNYKEDKTSFGTMLGISPIDKPKYGNNIFSGMYMHPEKQLYYTTVSDDSYLIEGERTSRIRTMPWLDVSAVRAQNLPIIANTLITKVRENINKLEKLRPLGIASTAELFVKIARGDIAAGIEATRKGNLELAISATFLTHAGGCIIDVETGESIEGKDYLEYGQDESRLYICAANYPLAYEILNYLK